MYKFINSEKHGAVHKRQGYRVVIRDVQRFREKSLEMDGMDLIVCGTEKSDAMDITEMFMTMMGLALDTEKERVRLIELPGVKPGAPMYWPVHEEWRG